MRNKSRLEKKILYKSYRQCVDLKHTIRRLMHSATDNYNAQCVQNKQLIVQISDK